MAKEKWSDRRYWMALPVAFAMAIGGAIYVADAQNHTYVDMCKTRTPEQITALIKAGADVNAKDKDGLTPVMWTAACNSKPDAIAALVKAGADVNAQAKDGSTPLILAELRNPNPEVITALVKAGADVNAKNKDGLTPLNFAAMWTDKPDVIAALVTAGADVNARDSQGMTPLMWAAYQNKHPQVITALVKAGADVNAKDSLGATALAQARAEKNPGAVAMLIQAGAQQGNPSPPANKASGPLFQWHMDKKTDALSGDVSTQPAATKVIAGANGKPQGFVSVAAYCSRNGVSIFFQADPGDKEPAPSFPWYSDESRGDDEQITDVRLRVDDRPVHVAQGFPNVDGHQVYTNTLGLLFYEPHTAERAENDQVNRVTTGLPALDGLVRGAAKQAAQSNVQSWQSSAAGPLSDLVNARSIRVELPVTTFDPKPLLDLNPQDPVLHKFVTNCNAKFTR
jgi:ankyrin repeat protein